MRKIIKAFEDLFLLVMKRWMSFIFLHTMMTQEGAGNFHSFSFCFIQIIFFIFFLAGWKMKMFPLRRKNKGKGSLFLLHFTDCEKYIIGDRRWRMWWKIRWWRWGGASCQNSHQNKNLGIFWGRFLNWHWRLIFKKKF